MSSRKALDFMARHGMRADIDPAEYAERMRQDMERGRRDEKSSMPMIPTYIKSDGCIPKGVPAAVIDAGGTNFRSGLVTFTDAGYELADVTKRKMPGTDRSATWEEFISFAADSIQPLMDRTDLIGFCFSYNADITGLSSALIRRSSSPARPDSSWARRSLRSWSAGG